MPTRKVVWNAASHPPSGTGWPFKLLMGRGGRGIYGAVTGSELGEEIGTMDGCLCASRNT
ncbi:hypothetical protein BC936DRAFT_148119 [Jimgerdemannia flammicorona]|uniref:Uncharacterized protein n=1 Tax=Jimgerdemannia flammicorona TaxID=994334 RepID=A0A433D3P2_9FUNG|nr:hypothetical protein BC936DRAFT_148119 [Jimgerdemannia flammicorona]